MKSFVVILPLNLLITFPSLSNIIHVGKDVNPNAFPAELSLSSTNVGTGQTPLSNHVLGG